MENVLVRDALAPLQWAVWNSGYRAVTATVASGEEARCLMECDPGAGTLDRARWYSPLQEFPGLFQIFAEIAPTEDGILEFARTYGKLGLSTHISFTDDLGKHWEWPLGETVADWQREIQAMRQAIALSHAIQDRNAQWFSDHTTIEVVDTKAIIEA